MSREADTWPDQQDLPMTKKRVSGHQLLLVLLVWTGDSLKFEIISCVNFFIFRSWLIPPRLGVCSYSSVLMSANTDHRTALVRNNNNKANKTTLQVATHAWKDCRFIGFWAAIKSSCLPFTILSVLFLSFSIDVAGCWQTGLILSVTPQTVLHLRTSFWMRHGKILGSHSNSAD